MSFVTLILVFVIIWWLIFFAALPVGVKAQHENTVVEPDEGTDPGAPSNPNLKKKAIVTTAIAFGLTVVYYFVATSGLIDFRQ